MRSHHHGKNAGALGAGDRDRARGERAGTARRLAKNRRALERAAGSRENQKFLHAGGARAFAAAPDDESRRIARVDFAGARAGAGIRASTAEGFSARNLRFRLQTSRRTASGAPTRRRRCRIGENFCRKLPSWWFLVDRYFAHDPLLTTGFVTTNEPVTTQEQKEMLDRELPVAGVPMVLSGWSFTLTDLVPWSHHQLILISTLMAIFDATLLALLYRDWRLWLIQVATLALAVGAMIASMKLLQIPLNLLNVLAFRLVLAIGVDYGIYVLLVWQKARATRARCRGRGEAGDPRRTDGDRRFRFVRRWRIIRPSPVSGSPARSGFFGAWPRRSFSPCPRRRRLNRRPGAKNLCSPRQRDLNMS